MSTTVTWTTDGDWSEYPLPWSSATFTWDAGLGLTWEQATYPWESFPFRWDNTSAENAPAGRTRDIAAEDRTLVADAETRTYVIPLPN